MNIKNSTTKTTSRLGSALIMTIVLTALMAIVGVVFLMASRVDNQATSAVSENKQLHDAVDSVIAIISRQLVQDVPGVAGQEYFDYPGNDDEWLACLEPVVDNNNTPTDVSDDRYKWLHISDISGLWGGITQEAKIVPDYQTPISPGTDADADGDGVSDAQWVTLPNITTNTGEAIYAAVRIIDNSGMINVNTAYKFDPTSANPDKIDGSTQTQINLEALSLRSVANNITDLETERKGGEAWNLDNYTKDVIWRPESPAGLWTPFDISDELKLRNRYFLNYNLITTRIEEFWEAVYDDGLEVPRTTKAQLTDPDEWFHRVNNSFPDPNMYNYRHISTTNNFDRIIDPNGNKMLNLNTAGITSLYNLFEKLFNDAGLTDPNGTAAQLAVNIVDFRDNDANLSTLDVDGTTFFGFEIQPFISEIAYEIDSANPHISANNHFAIELYNPFDVNVGLDEFTLELRPQSSGSVKTISLAGEILPAKGRLVIYNDPAALAGLSIDGPDNMILHMENSDCVLVEYQLNPIGPQPYTISAEYEPFLVRDIAGTDLLLDKQEIDPFINWTWSVVTKDTAQFFNRHDNDWNIVYQNLYHNIMGPGTLGGANGGSGKRNWNLATQEAPFVTVGDVGRVITMGPGLNIGETIGEKLKPILAEKNVRLDLQDTDFASIFQYLTVFDPTIDGIDNNGDGTVDDVNELKIAGRININTAPWYVIAQLPWMNEETAKAITAYRDGLDLSAVFVGGPDYSAIGPVEYNSTGELNYIIGGSDDYRMDYYATAAASGDETGFPDLTPGDGAADDFEEQNLMFSRISNLVTVRSDLFTAYILVRLGNGGPQKRVIAILDRSNVKSAGDKVKVIAWHPVPDPR